MGQVPWNHWNDKGTGVLLYDCEMYSPHLSRFPITSISLRMRHPDSKHSILLYRLCQTVVELKTIFRKHTQSIATGGTGKFIKQVSPCVILQVLIDL
jgi:hypothetical protein